MTDAHYSLLRLIVHIFPGARLWMNGTWRAVRPATAEERQRWGW